MFSDWPTKIPKQEGLDKMIIYLMLKLYRYIYYAKIQYMLCCVLGTVVLAYIVKLVFTKLIDFYNLKF